MTQTPLKVVLIGLGMVADTHLRALADLQADICLTAVCARTPQTVEDFAQRAKLLTGHFPRTLTNVKDIDPKLADFAIVLTPPNARKAIVAHLVKQGIPILMEKPVERDSAAAEKIVQHCEDAQVPLGIVFQHRVRAASMHLAALMATGRLGRLKLVDAYVPWWRSQGYYNEPGRGTYARDGGGVLISQAIHTLDLMLSLTGPVTQVQAMARTTGLHRMEAEDFVTAGMDFANGAVGSLVASTASYPGGAEALTLHFSQGVATLKSGVLRVDWRDGTHEVFGEDVSTGAGANPMAFTHEWHRDMIADFAAALRDNRPPMVTGRTALAVHRLIDALVRSSREKCAVSLT